MKVVIFTVLVLFLIVGFGIFAIVSINASASELSQHIDKLEENITRQKWQESQKNAGEISKLWSETKKAWLLFLDHQEIDSIDLSYAKLNKYVETKDWSAALAEVAALKLLVRHIPEISALNLSNIF